MKIPFFRNRPDEGAPVEDLPIVVAGPEGPEQTGSVPPAFGNGGRGVSGAAPGSFAFPTVSTYPSLAQNNAGSAGNSIKGLNDSNRGWGAGAAPEDPAKGTVYVANQRDTNPLIIKEKRRNRPIS